MKTELPGNLMRLKTTLKINTRHPRYKTTFKATPFLNIKLRISRINHVKPTSKKPDFKAFSKGSLNNTIKCNTTKEQIKISFDTSKIVRAFLSENRKPYKTPIVKTLPISISLPFGQCMMRIKKLIMSSKMLMANKMLCFLGCFIGG